MLTCIGVVLAMYWLIVILGALVAVIGGKVSSAGGFSKVGDDNRSPSRVARRLWCNQQTSPANNATPTIEPATTPPPIAFARETPDVDALLTTDEDTEEIEDVEDEAETVVCLADVVLK